MLKIPSKQKWLIIRLDGLPPRGVLFTPGFWSRECGIPAYSQIYMAMACWQAPPWSNVVVLVGFHVTNSGSVDLSLLFLWFCVG